jgi:hypothetical protein
MKSQRIIIAYDNRDRSRRCLESLPHTPATTHASCFSRVWDWIYSPSTAHLAPNFANSPIFFVDLLQHSK